MQRFFVTEHPRHSSDAFSVFFNAQAPKKYVNIYLVTRELLEICMLLLMQDEILEKLPRGARTDFLEKLLAPMNPSIGFLQCEMEGKRNLGNH